MTEKSELKMPHDEPGLDGRHRDADGRISKKRDDTLVKTLRKTYGDKFAEGYKPDATLGDVLNGERVSSLSELRKRGR